MGIEISTSAINQYTYPPSVRHSISNNGTAGECIQGSWQKDGQWYQDADVTVLYWTDEELSYRMSQSGLGYVCEDMVRIGESLTSPVAHQPASSPLSLPTLTPAPLAAATPISLPYPQRYTADGTRIEVTPVPAAPQVTCTSQGEVIACYDELLDMNFSYPAFMGQLLYTQLRKGGYSGYAYEYVFEDREYVAGGRSSNFSEGRGPVYTDHRGFEARDAADICAVWVAAMCQELGPGALLIVMLPQAEWLCSDAMMFTPIPRSILVLDLPQHPLINGFSFSFPLMPAEAEAAFRDEWYSDGKQCAPEAKVELGTYVEQLRQDLAAGTAAAEIQQRYDAMIQLADSIQGRFVAANP